MEGQVVDVGSVKEFDTVLVGSAYAAINFWAPWCEPCRDLDTVFAALAKLFPAARFLRVEAEDVPDVSERYGVSVVPFFVLLQDGKFIASIEGADAAGLSAAVKQHFAAAGQNNVAVPNLATPSANRAAPPPAVVAGDKQKGDLESRLKALVTEKPVMLFMKGTPEAPRCGFSRKVADALKGAGVDFGTFDILEDEEVRQGLKDYSAWPTYPQVYAGGELLGGCDVVLELQAEGQLRSSIDVALQEMDKAAPTVRQRVEALTTSAPVMLFMKGTPDQPRCGFSRQVVEALRRAGAPFSTFDILSDEDVRQDLKAFSDWPTFPQLYVAGELMGGCDIVLEMDKDGSLKETVAKATAPAASA